MAADDMHEQATVETIGGKPVASEGLHERIVDSAKSMVLWGESREAVFRKLEVNGITGDEAEAIHAEAMVERLAAIHAHYRRKAQKGLLYMGGGLLLLALCFFVFHVISRLIWIIIVLSLVFGAWHFVNGLSGMLMAKNHEGSVADLDD